jgi:outer membrane immunogenic protein
MRSISTSAGIALAAVLAASLGARAADLAPSYKAPIYSAPPAYGWNGFYAGINGGMPFGTTGASETGLPIGNVGATNDYNLDHKMSGWLAGITLGYNWQVSRWLFGVEFDIDAADMKGTGEVDGLAVTSRAGLGGNIANFVNAGEKIDYFGTLRARAGWLPTENLLLFGAGGLAFGHVKYSGNFHYSTPEDYDASESKLKYGWTIGGGAEYRIFANWTVKAEYLYYDLGKESIVADGTPPIPPFQAQYDFNTHGHIARLGVNYKF